jgi:hypothetical protein
MAINEGGATPTKVPIQKGRKSTPMTGDTMFMNQFGRNGVILEKFKNMIIFLNDYYIDMDMIMRQKCRRTNTSEKDI